MRRDARQARVERALRAETAFRRAMEDSLATGLAVIDRLGVLRHVNAAFCQMTGWAESDLVGKSAPLPYWPPGQFAEHQTTLNALLDGEAPPQRLRTEGSAEDGSLFDARIYGSPLLSDDGEQLGWMIAMADITEPKRISAQLRGSARALHHRAAVARRCSLGGGARRGQPTLQMICCSPTAAIARFMGRDAAGTGTCRRRWLPTAAPSRARRYDGTLNRWFDVRTRDIRWVDGRDVRLQIATDISDRKATEEIVRQQQEKVALTSRLMTMGEMASSLAHELNQPLTAISNYSLGTAVARARRQRAAPPTCFRHSRRPPDRPSVPATSSAESGNS